MASQFKRVKRSTRFASGTRSTSRSRRKSHLHHGLTHKRWMCHRKLSSQTTTIEHNSKIRAVENCRKVWTRRDGSTILETWVTMAKCWQLVMIWSMMKVLCSFNWQHCSTLVIKPTQASPTTMPRTTRAITSPHPRIDRWPGRASWPTMSRVAGDTSSQTHPKYNLTLQR